MGDAVQLGQPPGPEGLGGEGPVVPQGGRLQGCSLLRQWRPVDGVVVAWGQFLLEERLDTWTLLACAQEHLNLLGHPGLS